MSIFAGPLSQINQIEKPIGAIDPAFVLIRFAQPIVVIIKKH